MTSPERLRGVGVSLERGLWGVTAVPWRCGGGGAWRGCGPSEVIVICRFRIQDQVAVAVDFMQNIRTFGQKFLYLTKIEVLIPHHAFYQ